MAKEIWETKDGKYVLMSRTSKSELSEVLARYRLSSILLNPELRRTESYYIIPDDAIFQGV